MHGCSCSDVQYNFSIFFSLNVLTVTSNDVESLPTNYTQSIIFGVVMKCFERKLTLESQRTLKYIAYDPEHRVWVFDERF